MSAELRAIAADPALLNIGRKAVEDTLIDFRDRRISLLNRGNGLVARERDGGDSDVIRLGTEDALRIALRAIADHLDTASSPKRKD